MATGIAYQADAPYPFEHAITGTVLTAHNCLQIFYEYASGVTQGGATPATIFYEAPEPGGVDPSRPEKMMIVACMAPHPKRNMFTGEDVVGEFWQKARGRDGEARSAADFKEVVRQLGPEVSWSERDWSRRRFAYVAVWRLFQAGYITEHNRPTPEALADTNYDDCERFLQAPPGSQVPQTRFSSQVPPGAVSGAASGQRLLDTAAASEDAISQVNMLVTRVLKQAPQKGDVVDEYSEGPPFQATLRLVCLENAPAYSGQHRESKKEAKQSAARVALSDLRAREATLAANTERSAKEPAAAKVIQEKDAKTRLNELIMFLLRRPVAKGDIEYELLTSGPPFIATVRLRALDQSPLFTGKHGSRRMDAEKSAAEEALEALHASATGGRGGNVAPAPAAQNSTAPPELQPLPVGGVRNAASAVGNGSITSTTTAQAHAKAWSPAALSVRAWCVENDVPTTMADLLEQQKLRSLEELALLSEDDLSELFARCPDLKMGPRNRFKLLLKSLTS